MTEDLRCCGSGTCLINAEGVCWCGQRWDGEKMCSAGEGAAPDSVRSDPSPPPGQGEQSG